MIATACPCPPAIPTICRPLREIFAGCGWRGALTLGSRSSIRKSQQITAAAVAAFSELGCHVEEINPGFDNPGELFQYFFYVNIGTMLQDYPGYERQIDPQLLANIAEVKGVSGQDYARVDPAPRRHL